MDGTQMLLQRVLMMVGVKPEDLAAIEQEIPKLRTQIPAFAQALSGKVNQIDARLTSIESKLDRLLEGLGEQITSQELPPAPPEIAGQLTQGGPAGSEGQ